MKRFTKKNAGAYAAIDAGPRPATPRDVRRACAAQVRRDNYNRKHPVGWTQNQYAAQQMLNQG